MSIAETSRWRGTGAKTTLDRGGVQITLLSSRNAGPDPNPDCFRCPRSALTISANSPGQHQDISVRKLRTPLD